MGNGFFEHTKHPKSITCYHQYYNLDFEEGKTILWEEIVKNCLPLTDLFGFDLKANLFTEEGSVPSLIERPYKVFDPSISTTTLNSSTTTYLATSSSSSLILSNSFTDTFQSEDLFIFDPNNSMNDGKKKPNICFSSLVACCEIYFENWNQLVNHVVATHLTCPFGGKSSCQLKRYKCLTRHIVIEHNSALLQCGYCKATAKGFF